MANIESGEAVILVMHSPREKVWGVLDEITAAGVFVRGIDLGSFEDYITAILRHEPFIGLCDQFFPLWRVERVMRDEASGGIPSLVEQFEQRTGQKVSEF